MGKVIGVIILLVVLGWIFGEDPCEEAYGPNWMETTPSVFDSYKICEHVTTGLQARHPDN